MKIITCRNRLYSNKSEKAFHRHQKSGVRHLFSSDAFTLIELIITISILSILMLIAVLRVGAFTENSSVAAHRNNVSILYKACATYEATHPGQAVANNEIQEALKDYIKTWPKVPKGYQSAAGEPQPGQDYIVTISQTGDININPGK